MHICSENAGAARVNVNVCPYERTFELEADADGLTNGQTKKVNNKLISDMKMIRKKMRNKYWRDTPLADADWRADSTLLK